jgi:hypothetical protein
MPYCIVLLFGFHLNLNSNTFECISFSLFLLSPFWPGPSSFSSFLFLPCGSAQLGLSLAFLSPARPNPASLHGLASSPAPSSPRLSLTAGTHLSRSSLTSSQTQAQARFRPRHGMDATRALPRPAHQEPRGHPIKLPPRALRAACSAVAAFSLATLAAPLSSAPSSGTTPSRRFAAAPMPPSAAEALHGGGHRPWPFFPSLSHHPARTIAHWSSTIVPPRHPPSLTPDASSQPLRCIPLLALFLPGQTRVESMVGVALMRFPDQPSPPV